VFGGSDRPTGATPGQRAESPSSMSPARLVEDLRARGFTFETRGKRVRVQPWRELTPDEKLAVRRHKAAIRALVDGRDYSTPRPAPPAPRVAIPEGYSALGISVVNGVATHPLGDEHAAKILSGEVPRDEALRAEAIARRNLSDLRWGGRR
jgi:hypothetical protein